MSESPKQSSRSDAPYRVEPNAGSKMFPWNVIGPEGLVSGHPDEKGATREARQWNHVFDLGRAAAVSERGLLTDGFSEDEIGDVLGWLDANIDAEKEEGSEGAVRLLQKIKAELSG